MHLQISFSVNSVIITFQKGQNGCVSKGLIQRTPWGLMDNGRLSNLTFAIIVLISFVACGNNTSKPDGKQISNLIVFTLIRVIPYLVFLCLLSSVARIPRLYAVWTDLYVMYGPVCMCTVYLYKLMNTSFLRRLYQNLFVEYTCTVNIRVCCS